MTEKANRLTKYISAMAITIKEILQKLKECFDKICPWFKSKFFEKFRERRKIRKIFAMAFSDVLETSYLNPVLKKGGSQLTTPSKRKNLQDIIDRVDEQLRERGRSPIFAPGAFPVLIKNIKRYISRLISQSIDISEQMRVANVSDTHIEQAVDFLGCSKGRKRYRVYATIGGLLTGTTIPLMIRIFKESTEQNKDTTTLVVLLMLGIVGVALMAWGLVNE